MSRTNLQVQMGYDVEKARQLNDWETTKAAAAVRRSIDVKVAAVAYALNELFRAKPDLFPNHADPFDIAARVVADAQNGLS